jgi:hypothetical protein
MRGVHTPPSGVKRTNNATNEDNPIQPPSLAHPRLGLAAILNVVHLVSTERLQPRQARGERLRRCRNRSSEDGVAIRVFGAR